MYYNFTTEGQKEQPQTQSSQNKQPIKVKIFNNKSVDHTTLGERGHGERQDDRTMTAIYNESYSMF